MHISLDGFVAGPNGEMDWIAINDEIFTHVEMRIGKSNAAMYGRVTYEMMEAYWPTAADKPNATRHDIAHSKWYAGAHRFVLSTTLQESANTTIISGNIKKKIQEIKSTKGPELLLFGSPTATHALMELGEIDGYWLFVNPLVLGKGIPLFVGNTERQQLQLLSTRAFQCGVTELNYLVEGNT